MKKNQTKILSQVMVVSSVLAVFLAAVGATGTDIYLASTQWLLVAAVLVGLGVYLRLEG